MIPTVNLKKMGVSLVAAFTLLFLLIPVAFVLLTSLTTRSYPALPYDGVTFVWYVELVLDESMRSSFWVSIVTATIASFLSVCIGTIAAIGYVRSDFPYKEQMMFIMLLPMIISPVIIGFALAEYFFRLQISFGYVTLILGHTLLTIPYTFLIMRSGLMKYDEKFDSASRVLGANPLTTFRYVTAPIIFPSLVAAYILAYIVSFGEFTATQFLVSPDQITVPIEIYSMLRDGISPIVSALSTVLIGIMLVAAALSAIFENRSSKGLE